MLGANLVSVQKLLGHSDPKITERRYGHLLPEFMSAEVNGSVSGWARRYQNLAALHRTRQAFAAAELHWSYNPRRPQKKGPGPHRFPVKSRPRCWRGVGDSNPWPPA